jgi:hypothetical protein
MAKQTINIGAAANDGTGDPIRTAFGKVNDNFTEIYTANTGVNTGDQNLAAYATTAAVAAGYQPLDSDLTAIAALTTTAYGRALLSTADAPTLRTAIGLGQTDSPTFSTVYGTNLAATANVYLTNNTGSYFFGASSDTSITRDGAPGILAQRNGTAKQTLRIYNTYTSATVYERAVMDWNGPTPGNLQIGTEFLGSGSGMAARPIDFVTGGVVRMSIAAAGNVGIGTTTPASGLHIAGALGTNTTTYDSAAALKLTNTSGGSWLVTSGIIGVANAHFSIRQESVAQPAIVVTGPGNNVGIGINAPAAKLDILDTTLSGSGSLAGSALNIAQTWNTTGNPSLIYGRVVNTNSGGSSNLIDLGTFAGGSLFRVDKTGAITCASVSGTSLAVTTGFFAGSVRANTDAGFLSIGSTNDVVLTRDAAGILAQRNGTAAQTFRVYDSYDTAGTNYERATFGFPTGTNTLRIGTEQAGTGVAQPIDFVVGGVARMTLGTTGILGVSVLSFGGYTIGGSGNTAIFTNSGNGQSLTVGIATNTLMLGGITSAFPAIKRSTTSLQARLADDSAFTNIQGKLTTDTAYTATVVVPTGFLTLYDSTGTAYRVPCVV